MGFFEKLSLVWQNVSIVQRALLLAIILTFIVAGGLLTRWVRMPDFGLLYQDLAPEEASKITDKLSEKDVPYELRNGGKSVYAPKNKIYQLRLDMAKDGLPSGQQGGYKIFDNEKVGISPFVQKVNLKRALQDELAKSIQMIDGVVHVRVHLVSTKQTLFSSQDIETTASVVLRLRAGYRISNLNVAAITHLIAGSVQGLEPEKVTVIDSKGHLLSRATDDGMNSGANTVADYKERVEQGLVRKIEEMLTTVLGYGRASVRVSAVIDMTSVNLVTKSYDPKGLPIKEEIKEKSKTEAETVSGSGEAPISGGGETDNTIITEMLYGEKVERKIELPGKVKSLSVAAVVDLSPADVNGTEGTETAKIMELADVEKLIENALGLDLSGLDSLKVVEAKFYRPVEQVIEEEVSNWPRYLAIARHSSLGIMAVCALLVLRMFSGAKKGVAPAAARQLAPGEGAAGYLPGGGGNAESAAVHRQIAQTLQGNPDQAKVLFNSWLQEKGE